MLSRNERTESMTIRKKALGLTAVALAAVLALTACSSAGGKKAADSAAAAAAGTAAPGGGGGAVADTPRYVIAMTTHEAPGDAFWDKIRAGAQAAAAKDNVELKYSADPAPDKQATLIQNAVDSKVDGLATTMSAPDALSGSIKVATDAGIPVVGFNAGINDWKKLGAIMYFGSDETIAGNAVGERLAALGAKHPICVIQEAGQTQLEARCKGVADKVGGVENLQVNGRDATQVTSTIGAKLQADPSIDYVVTLGAQFAVNAIDSVGQANSSAKVVTFDLNADAAKLIKEGKILFAVDQQPYLQGYEAIDTLWLYLTNRNTLGGGLPVLTGPAFVDADNIDVILPFTAAGTR
jgi:simple sugar transport system substrate-binding protein